VPLSTSSSDAPDYSRALPSGDWLAAIAVAFGLLVLTIAVMEIALAERGFAPTIVDSPRLWVAQRIAASQLGRRALILVGDSRMQLDVDTTALRSQTHLTPVQLAIDGTSFVPVLEGLAKDPTVLGTVVVQFDDVSLASKTDSSRGADLQAAFDHRSSWILDYANTEDWLEDNLHSALRSYADGSLPISALVDRLIAPRPTPQYLRTLPDRSRAADYGKVAMPDWYFGRVMKNLGEDLQQPGMTYEQLYALLVRRIGTLQPEPNQAYEANIPRINAMADAIRRRGGRVIFVVFPTSGLVKAVDDARYPRALFWARFAASSRATTLNFADVPSMQGFICPDGSHLDARQRTAFTTALVAALALAPTKSALPVRPPRL